jgi:hypothetical protein
MCCLAVPPVLTALVILFDNVVEVFDLPNRNWDFAFLVQLLQRCVVGAALVHRDLVRHSIVPHGFLEEAPGGVGITLGGQQEIDRLTLLVDCPIQILPGAVDFDVGLIPSANSGCLWSQFSEGRDACLGTRPFFQPPNDTYSIDTNRCKDLLKRGLCNTNVAALTHTE